MLLLDKLNIRLVGLNVSIGLGIFSLTHNKAARASVDKRDLFLTILTIEKSRSIGAVPHGNANKYYTLDWGEILANPLVFLLGIFECKIGPVKLLRFYLTIYQILHILILQKIF
jgi:hypothetical protein